jgi:hypothetical protein
MSHRPPQFVIKIYHILPGSTADVPLVIPYTVVHGICKIYWAHALQCLKHYMIVFTVLMLILNCSANA